MRRKQSPQPSGDCLEKPSFLKVLGVLCEPNRQDFLNGLGEGFGWQFWVNRRLELV